LKLYTNQTTLKMPIGMIVIFSVVGLCCICEIVYNLPEVLQEIESDERMTQHIESNYKMMTT